MDARHSHTKSGKVNKAKCLNYHEGQRCGRVAKHEAVYTISGINRHQPICPRCLEALRNDVNATGLKVLQSSKKGFIVESADFYGHHRAYKVI